MPKTKAEKVRRTVKGETYLFTKTAYGWGVSPAGKRGDMSRTYRGYNVYVNDRGEPTRCSCPDYAERSKRGPHSCKHMEEVAGMRDGQRATLDAKYPTPDLNEMAAALCPDDRINMSGLPKMAVLPVPEPAPAPAEYVLVNDAGWTLVYEVHGDRVRIGRRHRGAEVSSLDVPRAHARRHYAAMKIEGFKKP
jgi:hypothetical protein